MEDKKGQILLYQTPDGESRIEVRLEGGNGMAQSGADGRTVSA